MKGNLRDGLYTVLLAYGFPRYTAKTISTKLYDVIMSSDDEAALSLLVSVSKEYPEACDLADVARELIKHSRSYKVESSANV